MNEAAPRHVGRYVIHSELASGGMATVHLGQARGVGGFARVVAIKRLHPQFVKDPAFVEMFTDEARLASRIQHPNVVPTLDVVSADDELFVVMEYVTGETLARLIVASRKAGKRIPAPIAGAIACQCLAGLQAAHDAVGENGEPLELVHRDVSPQNVILGDDGTARLLDFGVAKARGRLHVTAEGIVKGKLGYMAPEQLLGEALDRRTDVYAAAVVLWECLTTKRLFAEEPALAPLLGKPIQAPSTLAPDVPPALDAIVVKALSAQAAERYPTARAMAEAIAAAVPLATPTEIANWVAELAGTSLHRQAELVKALDVVSARDSDAFFDGELPSVVFATPAATKPRTWLFVAVAALFSVFVAALSFAIGRTSSSQASSLPPTATSAPALPSTPSEPPPADSAPALNVPVSIPPVVRTLVTPPPASSPRVRAAAPPGPCNPPYVVARDGHKTYKRACLE